MFILLILQLFVASASAYTDELCIPLNGYVLGIAGGVLFMLVFLCCFFLMCECMSRNRVMCTAYM